jgi:hypothetical protein
MEGLIALLFVSFVAAFLYKVLYSPEENY